MRLPSWFNRSWDTLLSFACIVEGLLAVRCEALLSSDKDECQTDRDCTISPYLVCSSKKMCIVRSIDPGELFGNSERNPDKSSGAGANGGAGSEDTSASVGGAGAIAARTGTAGAASGSGGANTIAQTVARRGSEGGTEEQGAGGAEASANDEGGSPNRESGDEDAARGGRSRNAGGAAGASTTGADTDDCNAPDVFCDDFEIGTLGKAARGKVWTSTTSLSQLSIGTAGLDTSGVNGTKGMHIRLRGANADVSGMLVEDLESLGLSSNGTVDLQFDFRADKGSVYPFGLFCGAGEYQISFDPDSNKVTEQNGEVNDQFQELDTTLSGPDTPGEFFQQWRHVRLVLDRNARTLSMSVDDVTIFPPTELHGVVNEPPCKASLGVLYVKPSTSATSIDWDGYYDNVQIRVSN